MCGIAGIFRPGNGGGEELRATVRRMAESLVHRGPDDAGDFLDTDVGLAFGFRRLAIQDLSEAGHQPMRSASGRYLIVFNGEIYNFHALRNELEQAGVGGWRGHSDTEVLLAAIERWGLEAALDRADGMFAIALYDREARTLALARDRFGEKPLYYGWVGGAFRFASELKAIVAAGREGLALDPAAAGAFLALSYVPAPASILAGIRKLPPGHVARLPLRPDAAGTEPELAAYWRPQALLAAPPFEGGAAEAADAVEAALVAAIRDRRISDRPLGCFFSGGIDSTVVTALAAEQAAGIDAFTIGFHDARFDEAGYAQRIAERLGVRHHVHYVDGDDMLAVVDDLPRHYDEPFGDVSALPTLALSRFTRETVTVALSGDGGDELFGGYERYLKVADAWRRRGRAVPLPRAGLRTLNRLAALWPRPGRWGDKLMRRRQDRSAPDIETLHRAHMSRWRLAERAMPEAVVGYFGSPAAWPETDDPFARTMFADSQTYLPDDLLVKVDRASMAHSLEVRTPFLGREVAELAWRLPSPLKLGPGGLKRPLRAILAKRLDRDLFERPKAGFEPPLAAWLRGPLRPWAEEALATLETDPALAALVDARAVHALWKEHLAEQRNWHFEIWNVLMLAAWQRHWTI